MPVWYCQRNCLKFAAFDFSLAKFIPEICPVDCTSPNRTDSGPKMEQFDITPEAMEV